MTRFNSFYGSKNSPVVLCMQNSLISTRITSLHGSQTSPVVLCMQNNVISTRITSLHGSQTSPVALSMQNKVIIIRIASLYGSQPSFVVFVCKTASFGSELQVSMGPIETCSSGPKVAVVHAKCTNEGWVPYRLVILMLVTVLHAQNDK